MSKADYNRTTRTFYTNILKTIRNGASDTVFTKKQVEELEKMLKSNEKLIVNEKNGYIWVSLLIE